jgi:hypothetical protein
MKDKCICTTFKLSVAALAGVALAGVAVAEGQKARPAGNPLGNKSPALEQREQVKREKSAARTQYNNLKKVHQTYKDNFQGIAGPGVCPNGAHDCCTTGTPGCSDTLCCSTVCLADPFCCGTAWDSICVSEAQSLCGIICGGGGVCPPSDHDCCTTGIPGCTDTACCNTVCTADPFCCSVAWDTICRGEAISLCGIVCALPCPNPAHDCCTQGSPGCSDTACCSLVCAADPFCCSVAWDGICVGEAISQCGIKCTFCPDVTDHDCFSTGTPGCTDPECCEAVCAVDGFCCSVFWDGICVNEALLFCEVPLCEFVCPDDAIIEPEPCGQDTDGGCNSTNACAGASGNCCIASGGIGCEDPVCSSSVCSYDSFCCSFGWDGICASEACTDANCQCDPFTGDPFVQISCGDSVCGTEWSSVSLRDTDWYKFCVGYCGTNVNWSVFSNMPTVAFILNDDCGALVLLAAGQGLCPVRAQASLMPGTYIAFVAPAVFADLPCLKDGSNDYLAVLTCEAPRIDAACPGDIAGGGGPPDFNLPNGTVDVDDLLKVINNWGDCDPNPNCN